MTNNNELYNFLSNFTPVQIESLIKDLKFLANKKNKIIYIVDTYDIINYALPFTNKSAINNSNKTELSDRTIAYDYFFNLSEENKESKDSNLMILDEYKVELLSIKNQIQSKLRQLPGVIKQLFDLFEGEKFLNQTVENAAQLIINNFDVIVALQVFIEHGHNIYEKFFELLNDNLHIYKYNTGNADLDDIVVKVFDENRPSEITEQLYHKFVDDVKMYLISLKTDYDRHVYLENAYRDIAVIDRILRVNKAFKKYHKDKHVSFRYLSSAPFKTDRLFSLLKGFIHNDYDIDINRNIFQCYLLKSLNKIQQKDISAEKILEVLQDALNQKLLLHKNKTSSRNESHQFKEISNTLSELLHASSKNVKNSFIYDAYAEHQGKLTEAINSIQSKKRRDELFNFFKKTDSSIKHFNHLFNSSSFTVQKLRQTYVLANRLNKDGKFTHELDIPFGRDIIRNTFHHLPVLLFLHDESNEYVKSLHRIFNFILIPINDKISDPEAFNQLITKVLKKINPSSVKSLKEYTLELLVIAFINLITESPEKLDKTNNHEPVLHEREEDILMELSQQRTRLEHSTMKADTISDKGKLQGKTEYRGYLKEIDYLILWLKRRTTCCKHTGRKKHNTTECIQCNYDDVIEFGHSCIKKYNKDGRFYHGLALAYHSKGYGTRSYCNKKIDKNCEAIKLFAIARSHLKIAITFYESDIATLTDVIPQRLLKKNIIALHNTVADGKLREYDILQSKDMKELAIIRKELDMIYTYFSEIGGNAISYPSIAHTKAEILYNEANLLFDSNKVSEALDKINSAITIIDTFEHSKHQLLPELWEITPRIESWRYSKADNSYNEADRLYQEKNFNGALTKIVAASSIVNSFEVFGSEHNNSDLDRLSSKISGLRYHIFESLGYF